nr:oligosaccharide flippase family protein [Photobacterium leiognathi]
MLNKIIFGISSKSVDIIYSLVIGIMIMNYLGPEEQGKIAFINNLSLFLSFFLTLGLNSIFTVICGSNKNIVVRKRYGNYAGLRLIGFLIFSVIIFSVIYITKPDVLLISVPIILSKFFVALNLYPSIVDGRSKFKEYTISQFISLSITSSLVVFLIKNDYSTLAIAMTFFCKELLSFIVFYILYDKGKYFSLTLNNKSAVVVFRKSSKLMLSGVVIGLFTQVDILMIGWFISDSQAGIFSASTRFTTPLNFISLIVVSMFISNLIIEYKSNKDNYYRKISLIISILLWAYLIIISFVYIFGSEVFFTIFSIQYLESLKLFYINIIGLIFIFLGAVTGNHLVISKDYSAELRKTFYAAILNVTLNCIGIYFNSLAVIAISSVLSYALANLLFFVFYKDKLFFIAMIRGCNLFLPLIVLIKSKSIRNF